MHSAHGLRIRSTLELPGFRQIDDRDDDDLELRWRAPTSVGDHPAYGDVLLRCHVDGRLRYSATTTPTGHCLRFHGCCQFMLDAASQRVDVHMHPAVRGELGAVVAAGSLVTFVLALRGHTVLHASAVETPHGAVAVTGPSGSGKSTVAALACAGGLPLVTDDVLRVDLSADGAPVVVRGANEIRLRPASQGIVGQFAAPIATRRTVDGRLAVRPPATDAECLQLAAVVLPRPRRDRSRVSMRRLAVTSAMVQLLAMPRLLGWEASRVLTQQFEDLAALVRRVPVFELDVPWGPPFAPTLGRVIAERLIEAAADARRLSTAS